MCKDIEEKRRNACVFASGRGYEGDPGVPFAERLQKRRENNLDGQENLVSKHLKPLNSGNHRKLFKVLHATGIMTTVTAIPTDQVVQVPRETYPLKYSSRLVGTINH